MDRHKEAPGGRERIPLLTIEHIRVRPDRIVIDVLVRDERAAFTTPGIIAAALRRFPHLLRHACVNEKGTTFSAVANDTSLPHLFEHMAIEEQVRLDGRDEASYVGKTFWTDRRRLKAQVEISYADDLVALRALKNVQEWMDANLALDVAVREAGATCRSVADAET